MPPEGQLRAGSDRAVHLGLEVVHEVPAGEGTDVRVPLGGIADLERRHGLHEGRLEAVGRGVLDDEPLGGDAALAVVYGPRHRGLRRNGLHVGVGQDDEGVRPAEFQDGLLERGPRLRGHGPARGIAARERHGAHRRVADDPLHHLRPHEQGLEGAHGEARLREDALDGEGAAGHVGRVLQKAHVARHQRRGGEPEDLPEGKVPGHHGEHGPDGIVAHETVGRVGRHVLGREEALGVFRVEVADPGALLGLAFGGGDRLAHFARHEPRVLRLVGAKLPGRRLHEARPLGKGRPFPKVEGPGRQVEFFVDFFEGVLGVVVDEGLGGWIDRFHGFTSHFHYLFAFKKYF